MGPPRRLMICTRPCMLRDERSSACAVSDWRCCPASPVSTWLDVRHALTPAACCRMADDARLCRSRRPSLPQQVQAAAFSTQRGLQPRGQLRRDLSRTQSRRVQRCCTNTCARSTPGQFCSVGRYTPYASASAEPVRTARRSRPTQLITHLHPAGQSRERGRCSAQPVRGRRGGPARAGAARKVLTPGAVGPSMARPRCVQLPGRCCRDRAALRPERRAAAEH